MKVSVIIPTFKRSSYLAETLKSVVDQEGGIDYEVLVIDNEAQPSLNIMECCRQMHSARCLVSYVHEGRVGLHYARHAGAHAATGEILAYIDDDVICGTHWLKEMISPYRNSKVALVAGRVRLLFETPPPDWVLECQTYLSAMDDGAIGKVLAHENNPVGCNMSVRKSVLLEVGGFNPDGFGNPQDIVFRGDGENGLARKVREAGYVVWYSPGALLQHRVPIARISRNYMLKRAGMGGIEDAYADIRYRRIGCVGIALTMLRSVGAWLYRSFRARWAQGTETREICESMIAVRARERARQKWRQIWSARLRRHAAQGNYMESGDAQNAR